MNESLPRGEPGRATPPIGAWALIAIVVPAAGVLATQMSAVDLAYQIRAGEMMLDAHQILRTDPFTFTTGGHSWVDQQWGAQLALAGAFRLGGWPGLLVLRAGLIAMTLLLLYLSTRRAGADPKPAAWLTLGAFLTAAFTPGSLSLRPQLLATLFFGALILVLANRQDRPRVLASLPFITLLWAHVHGSFMIA